MENFGRGTFECACGSVSFRMCLILFRIQFEHFSISRLMDVIVRSFLAISPPLLSPDQAIPPGSPSDFATRADEGWKNILFFLDRRSFSQHPSPSQG